MKKTTQQAADLFTSFNSGKVGSNTRVTHKAMLSNGKFPKGNHFIVLELFGNEIAAADSGDGSLYITNAGWKTATTKERLNGLPNVSISQIKGKWFLNGDEWNGEWILVK